ncbi:hypothetical protein Chor_017294 [Crotalus horridus]
MKKFLQEIKADLKFKTAGPGQKLAESPREKSTKEKPKPDAPKCRQGPTNEAQMAAAAALARLEQKPKPRPPSSQDAIRNQVKKELMAEAAASDKGIPVDQKYSARDPIGASIMQIHTFNRDREKERIHCLEGADSFFQAVGFEKVTLDVAGQALEKLEDLREHREQLLTGEPVPSALLTFVWDAEVMADIQASQGEHMGSVLKPDLLLTVQMLS